MDKALSPVTDTEHSSVAASYYYIAIFTKITKTAFSAGDKQVSNYSPKGEVLSQMYG